MNIYQINQALAEKMTTLGELLQDGGEPTQEQIDECVDLQGDLENKLVAYGYVIKNLTGELDSVDSEIKRLTAIKKAKQRHIETLTGRMQSAMVESGINEVSIDPKMPIKLKQNPPSVQIDIDVERLPKDYIKTVYAADKTALAKALKGGAVIDGVRLESGTRIKIG